MGRDATSATPEELLAEIEWVRRVARALVGRDDSDEVVQQTYLQAISRPPAAGPIRSWLRTVLRNVVRRQARDEATRALHERVTPPAAPVLEPDETVARAELHRAVVDAVLALEEPYRRTLLLRFLEEREVAAIAGITNSPETTVRTRIRRGLEQVREALQARAIRSGGDSAAARALLFVRLSEFAGSAGGGAAGTGTAAGASSAAQTATAAGATAAAAGGIVMSLAAKLSLAGAAVVVAALSIWVSSRPDRKPAKRDVAAPSARPTPAVAASETPPPPAVVRAPEPVATAATNAKPDKEPTPAPAATFVSGAVRGTVVDDATGAPVSGADVWILPSSFFSHGTDVAAQIAGDALKDPQLALERNKPAATAITADDGYFECDKLSSFSDWQAIAFDAKGRCAAGKPLKFDAAQPTLDVELRLLPTFVLKGTVTDADHAPLVGATVIVMVRGNKAGVASRSMETTASPVAGGWTMDAIVAESVDVKAQMRGYEDPPKWRHVDLSSGPREVVLDFTLQRSTAIPIGGPIVDPAGAPIDLRKRLPELFGEQNVEECVRRHLSVRAIRGNPALPAIGGRESAALRNHEDDIYGDVDFDHDRYVVVLPPQFSGVLILIADSCVAGTARIDDRANPPPLPFEFSGVVPPAPWTTLVVGLVDAETGARVDLHRGEVSVVPAIPQTPGYEVARESTNPSGARVCEFDVRAGRVIVSATRKGFAPASVEVMATERETRRVVELELMKASASICGHVTIEDVIVEGNAWKPGVAVSVYAKSAERFEAVTPAPVLVNDAGRFVITGLAQQEYVVVAESHGAPAAVAHVRASDPPAVVELVFTHGENVKFHVPRPKLTFGMNDTLWRILDADGIPVVNGLHANSQWSVQNEEVQSTLSPGHYQILVWGRGCREATREFDVPAAGAVEVALERAR